MQISDGGSSKYVPLDLPPPKTDVVRPGETVRSFAQRHGTSERSLSAANHIKPDTVLYTGQQLSIPTIETFGPDEDQTSEQTPAERTDAAWDNYEEAVQHRDDALANAPKNGSARQEIQQTEDAAVAKARQEVDAAVV
jgi:murein DD-endopeptidase MepM/ murein hydrolase activator NlpD